MAPAFKGRNGPIPLSSRRSNVSRFLGPLAPAAVDGSMGGFEAADGERRPEPFAGGFAERLLELVAPPAPAVVEEGAECPAGSSSAAGGAGSSAAASRTATAA